METISGATRECQPEYEDLRVGSSLEATSSIWWQEHWTSAWSMGELNTADDTPTADQVGGKNLNAVDDYLFWNEKVEADWDGATDLEVIIRWENNVDNTGGADADTVDLRLQCYYKGSGDTASKSQILEEPVTVGKAAQYKMFETTFTINYDETDNVVEIADAISFTLNLETDTSEVDDIIINGARCCDGAATS